MVQTTRLQVFRALGRCSWFHLGTPGLRHFPGMLAEGALYRTQEEAGVLRLQEEAVQSSSIQGGCSVSSVPAPWRWQLRAALLLLFARVFYWSGGAGPRGRGSVRLYSPLGQRGIFLIDALLRWSHLAVSCFC